jgi:hypothetical protein
MPLLSIRGGIPAFASRVRAGEAVTIVAFGTSITLGGQYLAPLVPALSAATGNDRIELVNSGLRGYMSIWGAFRVSERVLVHRPDLVLIEFAHNELDVGRALESITPGLEGIISQIRAASPACEIVFVYLAQQGAAAGGTTPAMDVHEEIAEYFGIASIDLVAVTEAAVASGAATWNGAGPTALTHDGVHHTPLAAELLGVPFAAAMTELIAASVTPRPPPQPIRDARFSAAWSMPARDFVSGPNWGAGMPNNHETRRIEAYSGQVAVATAPGARLRLTFAGAEVFVWASGTGSIRISGSGRREPRDVQLGGNVQWDLTPLMGDREDGVHEIDVEVTALPVAFGDVFFVGTPKG